jgi:hypothetical protein
MKTKIAVYWPLAVAVTLAALAASQAYSDKTRHEPLAADKVSAELARAVSYGIIDGNTAAAASAGRGTASVGLSSAS